MTGKRTVERTTIALVDGSEPVEITASGELARHEPFDEAWFHRRVLELMYDVGRLKQRISDLEGQARIE